MVMPMQELVRFNALLSIMRSSLLSLGQAIQGLALMSSDLDALGRALFDGKVGGGEMESSSSKQQHG
jgi:dynein heavy chain